MTVCMDSPAKVGPGQAVGQSSWVLFVDDEPLLVDSYQRALCDQFRIRTATSAQQALALMEEHGAPAVVVADQQMPGMTGIEFLVRCQQVAPESVRVMLTGRADLPVAIQAVNQSEVFRFLTKPVGQRCCCP